MHEPGTGYDAIVVGAGLHGLATAYYLAERHGLIDVAVLDQRAVLNHVDSAFGRAARACGVDLIGDCEVIGILTHRGCVAGVETTRGCIQAPRVALATGRHASVPAPAPLDGLFVGCGALIEQHGVAAFAH
jgi:glycine/D-amino acid oxidase-like deaminating enzyme